MHSAHGFVVIPAGNGIVLIVIVIENIDNRTRQNNMEMHVIVESVPLCERFVFFARKIHAIRHEMFYARLSIDFRPSTHFILIIPNILARTTFADDFNQKFPHKFLTFIERVNAFIQEQKSERGIIQMHQIDLPCSYEFQFTISQCVVENRNENNNKNEIWTKIRN